MKISGTVHQLKIDFNVTPDIKRFVYVYLIGGKEGNYLIDTGVKGCEKIIFNYIHKLGNGRDTIRTALITHSHPDHIGAAKFIKERAGCSIYAGERERAWIEDIDQQFRERPIPNFYDLVEGSVHIDRLLADGEIIALEPDITLKVINAAGHSQGGLAFYYQEEKILFTGDAIPEAGEPMISDDSASCIDTIKRFSEIDSVHLFCPAWDKVYTEEEGRRMINHGIEFLDYFRECIEKCVEENPSLEPDMLLELIVDKEDMRKFRNNPLFRRSVVADLRARRQENRMRNSH